MKKFWIVFVLVLALSLSGCGEKQQKQMSYIGAESAKQLALESSGLTAAGAESVTADLNTRNGVDYYRVDIKAAGQTYQYDIDALTGVIIEANSPAAAAVDDGAASQTTPQPQQPQVPTVSAGVPSEMITEETAKEKALAHAGLTQDQVTFVKSKLDREHGTQIYDVEFYTDSRVEYDYEIDAYTGEVIGYDYENKNVVSSSGGTMITEAEAKKLALAQVPGAAESDIKQFKTDYDDGRTEYEGKIVYDGMEYEFEIDAYSGAIRSWEAEPARY